MIRFVCVVAERDAGLNLAQIGVEHVPEPGLARRAMARRGREATAGDEMVDDAHSSLSWSRALCTPARGEASRGNTTPSRLFCALRNPWGRDEPDIC